MARTVRDASLESRAARSRLKPRHEPYWRAIEPGRHIGYRKGPLGGIWKARMLRPDSNYDKETIGRADDVLDANGADILSFAQAQARARDWFDVQARRAAGYETAPEGYTVDNAARDYLAAYEAGHTKGKGRALRATRAAIDGHILPTLRDIELARLTSGKLTRWLRDLATSPARVRSRRGEGARARKASTDPDARRKRQATANRVLNVLKAVLNHAWHERKITTDDAWRSVRRFHDVDAPVVRYLSETECARLVNATEEEFRPMVRAALLTGCRYGELASLRVADFNADSGTLAIRTSKGGKPRHVVLTDEGKQFFADTTAGRTGADQMFKREDGEPWGKSHQQRPLREACKRAKIAPAISFHVLRHTHGSLLAMKGVPMPVIAKQLGHADTRMTEKHYAHLAPSYIADTIRANFPALGIVEKSKVTRIQPRAKP